MSNKVNYAIFRVAGVKTLHDLGAIGAHNKREKEAYLSNPDIDKEKSKDNITLVNCDGKYYDGFMKKVKPLKEQHDEKMKTERENRKKSFSDKINDGNNVVVDEYLFTSSHEFFENMNKEDIIKWANNSMEFVYKNLGYNKDQVLHSVLHLDEYTPHLHCVCVPLIKEYDKRQNKDIYKLKKTNFIKNEIHLAKLLDEYQEHMSNNGYDLERGTKESDSNGVSMKQYKKVVNNINKKITKDYENLTTNLTLFENQLSTSKKTIIGKDIVISTDTLNTLNKIVKDTKKIVNKAPIIEGILEDVNKTNNEYKKIVKENNVIKKELSHLETVNQNLLNKINYFEHFIKTIFKKMITTFKSIFQKGTNDEKINAFNIITTLHEDEIYTDNNLLDITKNSDFEEDIKDYLGDNYDKEKDDIDLDI